MKSKEFEAICLERMKLEEINGRGTMGRYGVQASMRPDPVTGSPIWQPMRSLPDFEGVLPPAGVQFILEAKVVSGASLCLHSSHFAERQLRHLYRRSLFGSACGLLIHFNGRQLKRRNDPDLTVLFPVWPGHPFWIRFDLEEVSSLSRVTAEEQGIRVNWNRCPGGRKPRPDILSAVEDLIDLRDAALEAGTLGKLDHEQLNRLEQREPVAIDEQEPAPF